MDITEAVELIRGEKGTPVLLTLLRETGEGEKRQTEKLEIELIRNEVVLEETRLETTFEPYGDGVIATFRLFSFYQDQKSSSAGDIRKALEQIKKEHKLKGVILDLRGNAGGLLTQAVNVTGLFINKGIVVSIKDSTWQSPTFERSRREASLGRPSPRPSQPGQRIRCRNRRPNTPRLWTSPRHRRRPYIWQRVLSNLYSRSHQQPQSQPAGRI